MSRTDRKNLIRTRCAVLGALAASRFLSPSANASGDNHSHFSPVPMSHRGDILNARERAQIAQDVLNARVAVRLRKDSLHFAAGKSLGMWLTLV